MFHVEIAVHMYEVGIIFVSEKPWRDIFKYCFMSS
jgi:hypothetical protein